MEIAIHAKSVDDAKHREGFMLLVQTLSRQGHGILCTPQLASFIKDMPGGIKVQEFEHFGDSKQLPDAMICVGGDGTLLDAIPIVRDSNVPVLGLNTGRLGFLAGMNVTELDAAIEDIKKGNYSVESRTLLQLESSRSIFDYPIGLNDFVIHKKETSSMIVIHTYLNGEFLNSYWSDGLIISTPTGSTGYSLSCGGPIIFPKSDTFVITPIAPHNLNVRPVIVGDDVVISFEIEGRASSYMASMDARSQPITGDVQMAVKKAGHRLNLIRLNDDNFLNTLRNKLSWGFDRRN